MTNSFAHSVRAELMAEGSAKSWGLGLSSTLNCIRPQLASKANRRELSRSLNKVYMGFVNPRTEQLVPEQANPLFNAEGVA